MARSPSTCSRRCSHAAARASERGAAVFVVVLVITLLSALGLFAIRSASLANVTAGYNRQMTQTHYVTDYGVMLMAAELGGDARQAYADQVRSGKYNADCQALGSVSMATCFPVYYDDLQTRVQVYETTNKLLIAPTGGGAVPGSLGSADLEGQFRIELTEIQRAKPPIEGMALTGINKMPSYYNITVSATGQVRPRPADPTKCDVISRGAAGVEQSRAQLVIGPLAP